MEDDEGCELPGVESSFADGFLHQVAFPFLALHDVQGADFLAEMSFHQANKLWDEQGLGAMVHQAHSLWRDQFMGSIRGVVGKSSCGALLLPA